MQIGSSLASTLLYSTFGQQGGRAGQGQQAGEEKNLPAAAPKPTENVHLSGKGISPDAIKEQQALTYSQAVKAPMAGSTVNTAYADATSPGIKEAAQAAVFPPDSEESAIRDGMPFAKELEEITLPGKTPSSEEEGDTEEAGKADDKPGTDKTDKAGKSAEDDPAVNTEITQL